MNTLPSNPLRRHIVRALFGGSVFFGVLAWNLVHTLRARRDELIFSVHAPRADPIRLSSLEMLNVDPQRRIWYFPRRYLDRYWSDPHFFAAGATFTVEFRGVVLLRGRVTHALDATRVSQPTLRVLQLRTGPGPSPLLAGDLGFAFALSDGSPS